MKKIRAYIRLFRPDLSLTAGTCVVLGQVLALGHLPSTKEGVLGFLTVFFISATALILNDYFDIDIDKINAPDRPLPSGLLTRVEVLILSVLVVLAGFATASSISIEAFVFVIIIWFLGFLYNWKLKKSGIWGNIFVCFSVGMTFVFGGISVGKPYEKIVWFMAIMTMLIDLGEEIAADSLDVEGDSSAGSRSLAVVFGADTAMKIAAAIFGMVILCTSIPFFTGWLSWVYAIPLGIFDSLVLFCVIKMLTPNMPHRIKYIRTIYLGGLGLILVFIGLRLLG